MDQQGCINYELCIAVAYARVYTYSFTVPSPRCAAVELSNNNNLIALQGNWRQVCASSFVFDRVGSAGLNRKLALPQALMVFP